MKYTGTIRLKDGRTCVLRNGVEGDAPAALENFRLTHAQTDWLLTYPDEIRFTVEQEAQYLKDRSESADEVELVAEVDGRIAGLAGIDRVGAQEKIRHRASLGISIAREYWGLGIGRALVGACIECARAAGYAQLELEVAAGNDRAIALYESQGFVECGRNPRGFRSRRDGWQELVLMCLALDA